MWNEDPGLLYLRSAAHGVWRGQSGAGKYARAGELFSGRSHPSKEAARHALGETLSAWTERLRLPPLRDYGIETSDFDAIVANCRSSSMKTNPIVLDDAEIREILEQRF